MRQTVVAIRPPIEATSVAKRFVSARELSVIIGRAEKTLERDRTLRRGLPYYRILGSIRYDLAEVLHIIEQNKIEPETR